MSTGTARKHYMMHVCAVMRGRAGRFVSLVGVLLCVVYG